MRYWFSRQSHLGASDALILFTFNFQLPFSSTLNCGKVGGGQNTQDFFLARRKIPWWVVVLSFVATEVSAVTIISVPAIAYMENWEYAQLFHWFYCYRFRYRLSLYSGFLPL